jgi:glycosyltransferase involved in cell wall biosynthesis
MPVFNREKYIVEALDSLLSQTFTDFEIIITDNASTDKTRGICEAYAKKDNRITYVRNEENIGAAENFNKVFNMASGEYFKWAASDDICNPDFLQRSVDILDKDPSTVLCMPEEIAINEDGNILTEYLDRFEKLLYLSDKNPMKRFRDMTFKWHGCFMVFGLIRRSILSQTSLIGSYIGSDRVLLAQLTLLGKFKTTTDIPIYFRRHEEQYCALDTDESRRAWFNPKCKGDISSTHLGYLHEYVKAINSFSPTYRDKLRGYLLLIEWVLRKRKAIFNEILNKA